MLLEIENNILKRCTKKDVKEVTIPDNVKIIENYAFLNCKKLENITIPDSVTIIGNNAFSSCYGLKSITIPDSVKNIDNMAFFRCINLRSVSLSDSVARIGIYVFSGCQLKNITIYKGDIKVPFVIKNWNNNEKTSWLNKFIVADINDRQQYFYKMMPHFKIPASLFMASAYPQESSFYLEYLKNNAEDAIRYLIDTESIDLLYRFLEYGFVTKDNIDSLICYAVEHTQNGGNVESQIMLSKYKSDNFGTKDTDAMDKFIL